MLISRNLFLTTKPPITLTKRLISPILQDVHIVLDCVESGVTRSVTSSKGDGTFESDNEPDRLLQSNNYIQITCETHGRVKVHLQESSRTIILYLITDLYRKITVVLRLFTQLLSILAPERRSWKG